MIPEDTIDDKVVEAQRVIKATLSQFKNPCLLWSSGKDSMVLLHLLLKLGIKPDIVCWREPWMPEKQEFTNRMIERFNLNVFDYAPSQIALCEGNGRIDVINYYQTGPHSNPQLLALARGMEEPEVDKPWLCGLDTFVTRPTGSFDFPWDVCFHGHKSSDEDPTSGQIPLNLDLVLRPGAASASYPLRLWDDEDVFEYIEAYSVPFDETRYVKLGNKWVIRKDKRKNPDYYHTCFECMKRGNPDQVHCPKLGLTISNISTKVKWVELSAPYCNLRSDAQ